MTRGIAYHDIPVTVYAWDQHTAMVALSGFCVTLVPLGDAPHEGEPSARQRLYMSEFLGAPTLKRMETSFGELSCWANRRASAPITQHCNCSCGECGCEPRGRRPDFQRVLGAIYDRRVIRESLQWLYEANADDDAPLTLRLVPSPTTPGGPLNPEHPILIMTCGAWTGVVMCCAPSTTGVGADPLVTE